ncbi:site-2 protease family protein, partial [Rothia mucilaginosa]|uniref:site-2 protease family protein n=2 Tax=Rothia TaxID=32207 RepID=UPI0028DC184B
LKRMVIMLGGPTMNLLIGVVCTAVLICGFGTAQVTNKVSAVSECVPSVSVTHDSISYGECTDKSTPSPARAAGVQVGDRVVAVNGTSTGSWEAVSSAIRAAGSHPSTLTVERNGQRLDLSVTPVEMIRPVSDGKGQYARAADGSIATTRGGFVGVSPSSELVPGSITEVPAMVGDTLSRVGSSMLSLPQRVWELTVTLVTGGERSAESPVSVVGVSRIAGEVTATDRIDVKAKAAMLVSLVANMNLMLFAFNLIPLLPLDGGHVLGAVWEGVRRFFARLTGRKDPGPFDPVKLLPLTYVVAGAFIVMSVILIVADIVKPITLF